MRKGTGYTHSPYYKYLHCMIQRAKRWGLACDFTYGSQELSRFISVMGPIPEDMNRPSVGRYDHSKGYVFDPENDRWNFRWEELSENAADVGRRVAARGLSAFHTGAAGRRAAELGVTGFQTGAAAKAGGNAKTNGFWTGVAGRAGMKAQLRAGTHSSQTGKSAFHTGIAARASVASPNAPYKNKKSGFQTKSTCPHCGEVGMTANMKRWHFDKCKTRVHVGS